MNSLKRTPKEFLIELLTAFNTGDIDKFRVLKRQWETIPDLKQHQEELRVKIILLCLMEVSVVTYYKVVLDLIFPNMIVLVDDI